MFDRIARTYDLLNHLLSLGLDRHWRGAAIRRLILDPGLRLLDCGAGTGDMSLTALQSSPGVHAVLLDPAQAMLLLADAKAGMIPQSQYRLVRGAAESLPFPDASFDRFMVAFGVRNFADLACGMRELHRTLKPGGRAVVLEFTPDRSRAISGVFRWYMSRVMVPLGRVISRDYDAYAYLSRTVAGFLPSAELVAVFEESGFRCCELKRLALGVASLFVLERE